MDDGLAGGIAHPGAEGEGRQGATRHRLHPEEQQQRDQDQGRDRLKDAAPDKPNHVAWILPSVDSTLENAYQATGLRAATRPLSTLRVEGPLGRPLAVPVWGVAGRKAGIRRGEEVAEVRANSEDVRPLVEPEGAHVIGPLGLRFLVDGDTRIDVDRVLALGQEVGKLRIVDRGPVRPRGL